jgi:hypothetical protein
VGRRRKRRRVRRLGVRRLGEWWALRGPGVVDFMVEQFLVIFNAAQRL